MLRYARGKLTAAEQDFIPEGERHKVFAVAGLWTAIYLVTLVACVVTGSILPLMLIGLPRLYGAWHHLLTGVTQHIGLAEDVLDHRLNSRTVYINPLSRFVYWNMNYHVEHHMFPMVPYYALPALHGEDYGRLPKAVYQLLGRVSGDHSDLGAATARPKLLRAPTPAADRARGAAGPSGGRTWVRRPWANRLRQQTPPARAQWVMIRSVSSLRLVSSLSTLRTVPAVGHDDEPVAHLERMIQVVGDEHAG